MSEQIMAQYTELYLTYKERGKNEYLNLWAKFPSFSIDDLNITMYDLFLDKYMVREIGAETEELFSIYYRAKLEQMIVKYVPKINLFISNWNSLMVRKLTLTNSGSNSYYLNPITSSTENLKLDDKDTYENTQEKPLSMFGKTNAELMKQVLELKDIYNDCLEEFNTIFLGIY